MLFSGQKHKNTSGMAFGSYNDTVSRHDRAYTFIEMSTCQPGRECAGNAQAQSKKVLCPTKTSILINFQFSGNRKIYLIAQTGVPGAMFALPCYQIKQDCPGHDMF